MSTIPEMCMQYTKVFLVLKLELLIALAVSVPIALVVGALIGYWVRKNEA